MWFARCGEGKLEAGGNDKAVSLSIEQCERLGLETLRLRSTNNSGWPVLQLGWPGSRVECEVMY